MNTESTMTLLKLESALCAVRPAVEAALACPRCRVRLRD